MPRFDGTGPTGTGPRLGICFHQNSQARTNGFFFRPRKGSNRGRRYGDDYGNRNYGATFHNSNAKEIALLREDNARLQAQIHDLENRLGSTDKK